MLIWNRSSIVAKQTLHNRKLDVGAQIYDLRIKKGGQEIANAMTVS